ncbi:MAG: hypothetical protein RJQ04_09840 [Longimicrobiales bacterium]
MSGTRIDYQGLKELVDEGHRQAAVRTARRGWPLRFLIWLTRLGVRSGLAVGAVLLLLALPFVVLIRGGMLAYGAGWGAWTSVGAGTLGVTLLLGVYAAVAARRMGASRNVRKILARGGMALGALFVVYATTYVAVGQTTSAEVRAEFGDLHPLLRVAASTVFLVDGHRVMTDASRTAEDYWLMGLPVNEASLHFHQEDTGFVHALDLRTRGRAEWSNRLAELAFWSMGFHALRHVGTADHLHVSLRLPG